MLQLLVRDPSRRIGSNGVDELRSHPFFDGIDWDAIRERKVPAPETIVNEVCFRCSSSICGGDCGLGLRAFDSRHGFNMARVWWMIVMPLRVVTECCLLLW